MNKIPNQEHLTKLVQQFMRIINKYNAGEKKPHDYGTGNLLYRSEVHTIEAIGDNPDINVTELALNLGVTKGAVSQTIDKLMKKGLVNKVMASPGVNEVALSLTEQGKLVYRKHQEFHTEMYDHLAQLMAGCSTEQLEFLINVQNMVEGFLDNRSGQ